MKFEVQFSAKNRSEKEYILLFILHDFLGIDVHLIPVDEASGYYQIQFGEKEVLIKDVFLQDEMKERWLSPDTLPISPVKHVSSFIQKGTPGSTLPILYGDDHFEETEGQILIGLDIFGSAFFMLSRYEEAAAPKTDQHGRFPATESVAYKNHFLNRPIINEYIQFLKEAISRLWPETKFKKRQYRGLVSCDVDHLRDNFAMSTFGSWKKVAGDVIKRKSIAEATDTYNNWFKSRIKSENRFDTFDFMMRVCEEVDLKQAFYFRSDFESYDHEDPMLHTLLRNIDNRGHEIGIHFGYDTYLNLTRASEELEILQSTLQKLGIKQTILGGRQHYLRWRTSETAVIWDALGLKYDSTLGYGDYVGFRSGFCSEYPLYDLTERKALGTLERPLVVMECSLLSSLYMNYNAKRAFDEIQKLYAIIKRYDGDFTLLWHNSYFNQPDHPILFRKIIDLIAK